MYSKSSKAVFFFALLLTLTVSQWNSYCSATDITGNICTNCYAGYYLNTNVCVPANPYCHTYDINTGYCLSCHDGYALSGTTCAVSIQSRDAECSNYTGSTCNGCYAGFYVSSSTGLCTVKDPTCATFTATYACATCYTGYVVSGATCVPAPVVPITPTDPYCLKFTGSVCTTCHTGYYASSINGLCTVKDQTCATFTATYACATCYTGYVVSGATCVPAPVVPITPTDPYCLNFTGSVCTTCHTGYYASSINGLCTVKDQTCATFTATYACATCYPGYVVSGVTCVPAPVIPIVASDPYCSSPRGSPCSTCYPGYFVSSTSGRCSSVNPYCATYAMIDGACQSCYPGMKLNGTSCSYWDNWFSCIIIKLSIDYQSYYISCYLSDAISLC